MLIAETLMVCLDRVRRKKHIRNAEGYLDLIMVFDDRWPLAQNLREQLADKAINTLVKVTNPQGFKPYILFLKGQAHRAAGRHVQAINYLEQSLRLDEDNVHTLLALAWCYKRVDNLNAAIEVVATATSIDPESAICHYNLACYYALDQEVEKSTWHLITALDLKPEFRGNVGDESDFDLIRDDPGFQSAINITV
jgi:tetratricopeptide (TPR) repeat protein